MLELRPETCTPLTVRLTKALKLLSGVYKAKLKGLMKKLIKYLRRILKTTRWKSIGILMALFTLLAYQQNNLDECKEGGSAHAVIQVSYV